MDKEFIPYKQALELKELGFDEECLDKYIRASQKLNSDMETWGKYYPKSFTIPAPLYQQAFRWFRNQFGLYAWVKMEYGYDGFIPTYVIRGIRQDDIPGGKFNTYEEAELACLKNLIDIVKNKSNE
jgi:hypothetical protein